MPTFGDLIHDVRNEMLTGWPDRINTLASPLTDDPTDTSVSFAHQLVGIAAGSQISTGLEIMYVVGSSGQSANVIRGFAGSTPAAHPASQIVHMAPTFTDYSIGRIINQGLQSLSAEGLYRVASTNFTYNPPQQGYDLDADGFLSVISVSYDDPSPLNTWRQIDPTYWMVDTAADLTDFPSGRKLLLKIPAFPGYDVRVSYRAEFTGLTALTDDVADTGLLPSAYDLPVLYAAYRLQTGREVKRSLLNRQPEPRRQEEVPPGAARNSEEALFNQYQRRIRIEANRLTRLHPEAI